jgi:hypothetical protein
MSLTAIKNQEGVTHKTKVEIKISGIEFHFLWIFAKKCLLNSLNKTIIKTHLSTTETTEIIFKFLVKAIIQKAFNINK